MAQFDEHARTVTSPPRASATHRDGPRFLPGLVLDRRFRIVAPLGHGGMGEVYRADDIRLGQTVALKFLPWALERDDHRAVVERRRRAFSARHPAVRGLKIRPEARTCSRLSRLKW